MALPTASDNVFPKLTLAEGGTLGTVAASSRRLGIDASGVLVWKDSGGATSPLAALNKWDGTAAPGTSDDDSAGYAVGSRWIDTTNAKEYVCLDASTGAAVWTETTASGGGGGGGISAVPDIYLGTIGIGVPNSVTALGAANRAWFVKFYCGTAKTVNTAKFRVGVQSGSIDIAIYDASLTTKLGSTGSYACPAVGAATGTFSSGIALSANTIYYLAFAGSSSTVGIFAVSSIQAFAGTGWNQMGNQDTAFPLPASPSPDWDNGAGYPMMWVY